MSADPKHELTVRRQRPEDDEPDRVPLTWALVMRMIGLTDGYKNWRTWLFVLCAGRAIQLPVLAWMLAHIIRGPIAQNESKAACCGRRALSLRLS